MLKSCGLEEPAGLARWLRNRLRDKALVLLYHRVAECTSDPYALCVTPQHFAEHLQVLRKKCYPIRLQQLVQCLRDGNLPRGAVVITFDDGYADNLYNAKPLLERYDFPATAFVTTGYIGQTQGFWWDQLEYLLLEPRTLPGILRLQINGESHQWRLTSDIKIRQRLYRSLGGLLRSLPEEEQQRVLHKVLEWSGTKPRSHSIHRVLSPNEVLRLAEGDLVEVGAHSITHPVLSSLSVTTQQVEIQRSKMHLEEILSCPVRSFAYPYGLSSDYTAETVTIVQKTGFDCACSAVADSVRQYTDPYQLPRIPVFNWNGTRFAWLLRWWGL